RDGRVPMPTISSSPSAVTSPTSATTEEVPMSSPTSILPLCTLDIVFRASILHGDGHVRRRRDRLTPGNGQAVGTTQAVPCNFLAFRLQRLLIDGIETAHFFHHVVPSEQQLDALAGGQEPAAPLPQFQACDGEAQRPKHLAEHLVLLHDPLLSPLRTMQLR